jgi:DNA-binding NtrC family response regulator
MESGSPSTRARTSEDGGRRAVLLEAAPRGGLARDDGPLKGLTRVLQRFGLAVDGQVAGSTLDCLDQERPTLAVVEFRAGDGGGFATLEALLRRWPGLPVLVVSASPTVADAVHAVQAGAVWYGGFPGGPDFERAVSAALEAAAASRRLSGDQRGRAFAAGGRIVGCSEAIAKTLRQSALVAPTRTTVLLLGETGTGKERLAQAIHEGSPRRQGPFVAVNCAALAESLLESELFGHEKGAFSGAHSRREGRFKSADGGTIFLDEIGELTLPTQIRLLRVLQERKFERVGGNVTLDVDVRVIAATNRNLREMVEERTFRADLFYRLNVMTIEIPPLRERRGDIPLLVEHLVPRLAREMGLPECPIEAAALEELCAYDWPGNVRELENILQHALVMAQGAPVTRFDLLPRPTLHAVTGGPQVPGASFREIERHAIMTTYEACGRSPVRTAQMLGISARTVHYRLREYRGDPGRRLPRPENERGGDRGGTLHVLHSDARDAGSLGDKHS